MNSKQSSKCCCIWCGKSYKTNVNLVKHTILCELIHKSSKKRSNQSDADDTDDFNDLPSPKKMYQMLLELGYKYSQLEEKMDEVNKFVIKKKKKINVLEWLNNNVAPSLLFDNLIDTIKIIDSDIEFLLENNFLDTMNVVLSRVVYNSENCSSNSSSSNDSDFAPLFAFVQKTNIFYAFVKEEDKGVWMELAKDKLCLFLMRIQMKISKAFCEWKKQRFVKNRDDENFDILCDKTLIKIMGNEFKQESTFNKMRAVMYNKMKTDMKAMVEYEFEF
jgi:hypothetical protein